MAQNRTEYKQKGLLIFLLVLRVRQVWVPQCSESKHEHLRRSNTFYWYRMTCAWHMTRHAIPLAVRLVPMERSRKVCAAPWAASCRLGGYLLLLQGCLGVQLLRLRLVSSEVG